MKKVVALLAVLIASACSTTTTEPIQETRSSDVSAWGDPFDGSAPIAHWVKPVDMATGDFRLAEQIFEPWDGSWVTLLCKYAGDNSEPHPRSWYENIASNNEGGFVHFWRENSYGQLTMAEGQVEGWYQLPGTEADYADDGNGYVDINGIKRDCIEQADPDVYFPDYYGVHLVVNGWVGCCAWGGQAWLTVDGVEGAGKVYGMTWMPEWATEDVYWHETGHGIGFGHSGSASGYAYGNPWDVMSRSHAHTIGLHKNWAGWASDQIITGDATIELRALAAFGEMAYVGEYTVEARKYIGYDQNIPYEAVVIHWIDGEAGISARFQAALRPGESFNAGGMEVTNLGSTADGFMVGFGEYTPPPDRDGDGVPDADDECPDEAGPASNNGCPLPPPPPDTDGDGVPDADDACPTEPGPANNNGCPKTKGPKDCKKKGKWACEV